MDKKIQKFFFFISCWQDEILFREFEQKLVDGVRYEIIPLLIGGYVPVFELFNANNADYYIKVPHGEAPLSTSTFYGDVTHPDAIKFRAYAQHFWKGGLSADQLICLKNRIDPFCFCTYELSEGRKVYVAYDYILQNPDTKFKNLKPFYKSPDEV